MLIKHAERSFIEDPATAIINSVEGAMANNSLGIRLNRLFEHSTQKSCTVRTRFAAVLGITSNSLSAE